MKTDHQPSVLARWMTRKQAAAYLLERGIPFSPSTLASAVTRGGGPIFRLFGRRALYSCADLDSWVTTRLSSPRSSSAEADASKGGG